MTRWIIGCGRTERWERARAARSWWLALALAGAACGGDKQDLSVEQLSRVVDEQRPTLKACYDNALEKHPYEQEVRMDAIIRVQPSGEVAEVELGEGGLPGMAKCVRTAILSWRFPEAKDETQTSLPIIFKPETDKPEG